MGVNISNTKEDSNCSTSINKRRPLQILTTSSEATPPKIQYGTEVGPKIQPGTGPKIKPGAGPKIKPGAGPKIKPEVGPKIQPGVGPKIQPGVGPKIQPGTGPKIQPGTGPKIKPGAGPKIQPGAGPKIKPEVGPKIQPEVGPKIQPGARPKIQLGAEEKLQSGVGPKKQPRAGPKIQHEAGLKIKLGAGPKNQLGAGQKLQPGAAPKIQPTAGPKIQPGTGQKLQLRAGQNYNLEQHQKKQPEAVPKLQPGTEPKIQLGAGQKLQPRAGPTKQLGAGPKLQSGAKSKLQPAEEPKIQPVTIELQRPPTPKAQRSKTNQAKDKKPLVVIAIDFGTVHSGFAYSFQGTEDEIQTAQRCYMLEHDRVPTALLLNSDETFHSFGSDAQTNFYELSENDETQFSYVENFKMQLYQNDKITRDMEIPDISGKKVKALLVFSMAIKHLKSLAEEIVFQTKLELKETFIQWMITIPAVSSDSSRQFMREAAIIAGIPDKQIRLVLEPEAAALYSRPRFMQGEIPVGFKYILADLGGGTSDICIHETLPDGKLREIYRTTGKITGGNNVDQRFIDFMKSLVGNEVWQQFSSNHRSACLSLINDFQDKKKNFKEKNRTIPLSMEDLLIDVLHETRKTTLQEIIKDTAHAGKLIFKPIDCKFIIPGEIIEEFFKPSVAEIIYTLKEILADSHDNEIRTLLLVGGYSESPYIRERIQTAFSDLRVVLVDDARLAVLKGAVMMGWKPTNIIQRRSRFTYGLSVMTPFIQGEHPESLMAKEDGEVWCKRIFKKIIEKGQIVEYGQTFINDGCNTAREQEEKRAVKNISLWRSTRENPQYCTEEEECTEVGRIVVKPPPEGWPDYWDSKIHLIVGETEFTVKYFNLTTGQEYKAQMDFL